MPIKHSACVLGGALDCSAGKGWSWGRPCIVAPSQVEPVSRPATAWTGTQERGDLTHHKNVFMVSWNESNSFWKVLLHFSVQVEESACCMATRCHPSLGMEQPLR